MRAFCSRKLGEGADDECSHRRPEALFRSRRLAPRSCLRRSRTNRSTLLAAIDAGAALRIPARDQHPVLRDRGAIEPDKRRSLHVVQSPFAPDVLPGHAVEDPEGSFKLVARELLGQALHVHGLRGADRNR